MIVEDRNLKLILKRLKIRKSMGPIVSSLYNPPSEDFHRTRVLIDEELHHESKIQGLVSCIYYPSQSKVPFLGHAELEIEGYSYRLTINSFTSITGLLSKMISSSKSGNGFPFFRFQISVTPDQLKDLRENSLTTFGPLCSMGVAKALSLQGKYTIPLPFTFSPFALAVYLTCAKTLGSKRISCIEFYGGKSHLMNLAKGIMGVAVECLVILSIFLGVFSVLKLSVDFYCKYTQDTGKLHED